MRPENLLQESRTRRALARVQGFSLLELMVTIVIIGILAAVAYPSYMEYVRRGNRSAAQAFMLTIAQRQEQHLVSNRAYTATIGSGGLNLTPPPETTGRYTFAIASPSATEYTITATAIGNQSVDGDLTLSQNGTKTPLEKWQR